MVFEQLYQFRDGSLPGYYDDEVWCESMHLTLEDLTTGFGDNKDQSPFITLKRANGPHRVSIPTFSFSKGGFVILRRLDWMLAVPPQPEWVIREVRRAITNRRDGAEPKALFCYIITAEAWPLAIGICTSEHELIPDLKYSPVNAFGPVIHDFHYA